MVMMTCLATVLVTGVQPHQQGPADYQRKMVGRTLWPKSTPQQQQNLNDYNEEETAGLVLDYPLSSFLTLSLSASDSEGRVTTGKPSVGSKNQELDFLQQLLRLTPDKNEEEEDKKTDPVDFDDAEIVPEASSSEGIEHISSQESEWDGKDPCSHPFHSWLCPKNRGKSLNLTPEPSKQNEKLILPEPSSSEDSGWDGKDPCSHPFHSWLCPSTKTNPPPPLPVASSNEASVMIAEISSTTTELPITTTTTTQRSILIKTIMPKASGWDEADSCSHPFHSWLCKPAPSKPPVKPLIPEASSNFEENVFIPEVVIPTTTTTTRKPISTPSILIKTIMPPKSGWDEADSCSHPFHSWLCNRQPRVTLPPPVSTTTPIPLVPDSSNTFFVPERFLAPPSSTTPKPSIIIKTMMPIKSGWDEGDSCSHPFHSWLCDKKTKSSNPINRIPDVTVPPPPPPPLPEAASNTAELLVLRPSPEAVTSGWEGADPCSHPFHSWLCNRARRGRQSAYSVQTEDDDIIDAAHGFDSQRLLLRNHRYIIGKNNK